MDDYSALAQRVSLNVGEVRGCLLLSRDGLVLGAYPDEDEGVAKAAWLRFCALGEPERSFVEFTDQVWAFVHRGPYGAFAVADVGVRPGILVDQLEQVLMSADEGRARRDTLRVPDASAAPSGKPRSSLHPPKPAPIDDRREAAVAAIPQADAAGAPPVAAVVSPQAEPAPDAAPAAGREAAEPPVAAPPTAEGAPPPAETVAPSDPEPAAAEAAAVSHLGKEPMKLVGGAGTPAEEEVEVDRVLLAKEFSGLLQVDLDDDEASS